MNRIFSTLRSLVVSLGVASCALVAHAQAPQPPEIAARAYMLVDVTAGQTLAGKDIDAPVEQASLTKLMTGYLVFDALRSKKINLQQKLPVSVRAWKMPGSRMFIDPKMQVPVDDLLKGMIVQSGNDATMALAEGVGGTVENFVKLMNDQARALGMKNTAYKNPEGLTEAGHTTTASSTATRAPRRPTATTATCCCTATPVWTASRPDTPKPQATVLSPRPSATFPMWARAAWFPLFWGRPVRMRARTKARSC